MNSRVRFTLITLHVLAALTVLLMVVMFASPRIQNLYGPTFVWKATALGLTLIIGVEISAWALRNEKKWAWRMALCFCGLCVLILLLPLGMLGLLGSENTSAWFCKSGLVDCRIVSLGELSEACKSKTIDCRLEQLPLADTPDREQIQTFNINIGDHVGLDNPALGAGRIGTPETIHRYLFTAAPGTVLSLKPEIPCTFGYYSGGWELQGPSQTIGDNALCGGHDRMELKEGGIYSLTFRPGQTGEYAFTLLPITEDVQNFSLNIGDLVAPDKPGLGAGRIETPGSRDRYTFTVEAGTAVDIQRRPPCDGKFFTEQSTKDEYGTSTSRTILDCSGPTSIRVKSPGAHSFSVSGENVGTGDYSFRLKLEGQLVSFPNGIECYKPSDYNAINRPGLTVKVKEILDLPVENCQKVERLVQLSTEWDDMDAQKYRLCEEHGEEIIDKDTYAMQREIIRSWRKATNERGR